VVLLLLPLARVVEVLLLLSPLLLLIG